MTDQPTDGASTAQSDDSIDTTTPLWKHREDLRARILSHEDTEPVQAVLALGIFRSGRRRRL